MVATAAKLEATTAIKALIEITLIGFCLPLPRPSLPTWERLKSADRFIPSPSAAFNSSLRASPSFTMAGASQSIYPGAGSGSFSAYGRVSEATCSLVGVSNHSVTIVRCTATSRCSFKRPCPAFAHDEIQGPSTLLPRFDGSRTQDHCSAVVKQCWSVARAKRSPTCVPLFCPSLRQQS